jgi:hypothetical protein
MTERNNFSSGDRIKAQSLRMINSPGGLHRRSPWGESAQWRIVLVESVHLLGLFLRHARLAKGARATAIIFEQLLRHLEILEQMPGHGGALILRRYPCDETLHDANPDYHILFGDLTIQGTRDPLASRHGIVQKGLAQLDSGLVQAFACMAQHQIEGLYIELPAGSIARTDELRLALNIMARFQVAVQNSTSITFYYFGRALTIPLIRNRQGQPDPNLTILAGLNGLTTMNTRALIKQAEAYGQMSSEYEGQKGAVGTHQGSYNQIFQARSLRAQIIRPPVELNNLAVLDALDHRETEAYGTPIGIHKAVDIHTGDMIGTDPSGDHKRPIFMIDDTLKQISLVDRDFFANWIDVDDERYHSALNAVLSDNYTDFDASDIGRRLADVSGMIYAIEKKCQDPVVIDRLLFMLQDRLLQASDSVLANIHVQNQGLKLFSHGRVVIAGLVHTRLIDLIVLVKDKIVTRHKIDIVRALGFDFERSDHNIVTRGFDLPANSANQLMDLLQSCFKANGGFHREIFESHIDTMAPHADTLFEMLWCFLKLTPRRKDRLALVNAIPLLMTNLKDSGRALRFMIDELCQEIYQVDFTDRNALVLANILLRSENKELYIDLQRTPEHVLDQPVDTNSPVRKYVAWRLNTDHIRIVTKFKTIHSALVDAIKATSEAQAEPLETQFLFALEREILIFMSLAGSMTARRFLRYALLQYGDRNVDMYQNAYAGHYLSQFINHLRIVIRGLSGVGEPDDIKTLTDVRNNADSICELALHPAQALAVKRTMKWVDESIKAILTRNS